MPTRSDADDLYNSYDGYGRLLVVETMKRIGFTASDYAKRHHGVYLEDVSRQKSNNYTISIFKFTYI